MSKKEKTLEEARKKRLETRNWLELWKDNRQIFSRQGLWRSYVREALLATRKAKLWRKNAFRCLRTERGKRRGTKLWIRLKYLRTTKLCLTLEVLNILLSLNETVGIETMALLFKLSPELTTTSTKRAPSYYIM